MLILKNGKIFTMEDEVIHYGDILIDQGKILEVDHNIDAMGAKVIDLHNCIVLPGFVDASTNLGLIESGRKFEGDDRDERYSLITPGLSARDGIYPWDKCFEEASRSGVTTCIVGSGNMNAIGSKSCAVKTKSDVIEKMLINPFVDIKATLGDAPKKWNQNKQETPLSRMGIIHLLRKTLMETKKYSEDKKKGHIDYESYDPKYDAMENVMGKRCPLKVTAHKAQDILAAIQIKEEFDINIIVEWGTEAYKCVDQLKKAEVPVFLGSLLTDKSSPELEGRRDDTGKLLSSAGICTSITTHHPDVPSELLLFSAAIAAKEGMGYKEALEAITINPAKSLGLEHRIGSISIGKDADIVVFDGDPLKSMSRAIMTIINGGIVFER